MPTKQAFLALLRSELIARYDWTKDTAKLDYFMQGAAWTLRSHEECVIISSVSFEAAWQKLGMTRKLTLRALRNLPEA